MNFPNPSSEPDSTLRSTLRDSDRIWRRAGVRHYDRTLLRTELVAELNGARADGLDEDYVLGDDRAQMLRSWAEERGMTGRAARLGTVIPAALLGATLGMSLVILVLYSGFKEWEPVFEPGAFVLPFYAFNGALAYLCTLLFAALALRLAGDPQIRSTVRNLAIALPFGTAACVGAGVSIAWMHGFSTRTDVFVLVGMAIIAGLTLTVTAARMLAVRSTRTPI